MPPAGRHRRGPNLQQGLPIEQSAAAARRLPCHHNITGSPSRALKPPGKRPAAEHVSTRLQIVLTNLHPGSAPHPAPPPPVPPPNANPWTQPAPLMTSPALLRLRRIHHHHRRRRKVLLPWSGTPSSWMVPSNHFSARAPPTATHALDAPRRHPRRLAAGTRPAHPAATPAAAEDERPPSLDAATHERPTRTRRCV